MIGAVRLVGIICIGYIAGNLHVVGAPFASLNPPGSKTGYLARLLINETPFPGERGYVSIRNTQAAMVQILWVVHGRIHVIPDGYRQVHIAAIDSDDPFDIITAGGVHGQCDGFFRDQQGNLAMVPRVEERVQYLLRIANSGGKPGKFAGLIQFAEELARRYLSGGIQEADRYARIQRIGSLRVTGRGYSWMTDRDYYNPGGNFVRIPNELEGSLGGNRFFTLRHLR